MVFGEPQEQPHWFPWLFAPSRPIPLPLTVQTCLASQTSALEKLGHGLNLCSGVLCRLFLDKGDVVIWKSIGLNWNVYLPEREDVLLSSYFFLIRCSMLSSWSCKPWPLGIGPGERVYVV